MVQQAGTKGSPRDRRTARRGGRRPGAPRSLHAQERQIAIAQLVCNADSGKLGVETACSFARLDELDVLITDSALSDACPRRLTDFGIEVVAT